MERTTKRHKPEGGPMGGPPDGYHGYPPARFHQPPYGPGPGGPPMGPRSGGYMPWQHAQYGGPPPPHSWSHSSPPSGAVYPQQGGPAPTPDRPGYSSSYPRGAPPQMRGPASGQRPSKPGAPPGGHGTRPASQTPDTGPPDGPPPPGYQGGWGPGGPWPPQSHWGNGPPPPGWQGSSPPPMHHPSGYGGPPPPSMYGTSPARSAQRPPRGTPEMMPGFPPGPPSSQGMICQPVESPDMEMYHSRGVGPGMDDESSSMAEGNGSSKDKGRGSYKCGRVRLDFWDVLCSVLFKFTLTFLKNILILQCGVPKKGHVCPYQPKLTRRPGEPLPEMRCAAIQVEMDEFMTLRRLNLRIQGFPESYASEPYMDDDIVVGEPAHPPHSISSSASPSMMIGDGGPTLSSTPHDMLNSPIRSSPIEDPISAA